MRVAAVRRGRVGGRYGPDSWASRAAPHTLSLVIIISFPILLYIITSLLVSPLEVDIAAKLAVEHHLELLHPFLALVDLLLELLNLGIEALGVAL